ncbi:MAG: hypothetical protein HQ555_00750 [Candidatus Aminicenantes bacterium]|nr:hypothetical protein [Candidatus Aminicenantes bacterium]
MTKDNETIKITEKDLTFLEKELSRSNKPILLSEMTKKLAYLKISSQLSQEVKKYDPYCLYEIGDLICKEYDEPLMIGSKQIEQFKGAIVLKIIGKGDYKDYNCEMLEVDHSGGGIFRKYIDYMKKTKTQVLLPANTDGKAKTPEKIEKKDDPRRSELPMTDKDYKSLEKNLKTALSKSEKYFNLNNYWQLTEKRMEIKEKIINEIKKHLLDTKSSVATEELVNKFIKIEKTDKLFELYCLSLTYILEKEYKKDFIYVSPFEWGKWHLKKILNSLPVNLPISATKAKLPALDEKTKRETTLAQGFPLKVYLTWREILSGGIKTPKNINKELSHSREYVFTDIEEEKDYTVYYYPSSGFFLGFEEFYESNNVPQGASLTLERKGPAQFSFWLKKSKKKLSVMKVVYDSKEDKFALSDEDVFTYALPNKIIHLERETLTKLFFLYQQRGNLDLQELLALIFKNFGLEGNNYSLHYLRAFHLVDILKQTTDEDVEKILLNSPEFSQSEKNKGIFLYKEKIEIEEEVRPEEPAEVIQETTPEEKAEEAPPGAAALETPAEDISPTEVEEKIKEEIRVEAPPEAVSVEIEEKPLKPAKERISRKKRLMVETERTPRERKGAKRFIEERIELEESEQEALIAVKAKEKMETEEVKAEPPPKEKKEKIKPYVSEEPAFGIFAEKLKTALGKKKKK